MIKKITVEYETKDDLKYALEQQDKGAEFDRFDEYLRQLLKYGGISELISQAKQAHKNSHDEYSIDEKYKKPNTEQLVHEIISLLRSELNNELF